MTELGELIAKVVKGTTQAPVQSGADSKKSKAKYFIDSAVKSEVHTRIKTLMERFPVYPELDLQFLKKYFAG